MIRIAVSVYAAMIRDRMHFAQASYRDGEWSCILGGFKGHTTNHQDTFTPELQKALIRTLTEPNGQWCGFWLPDQKGGNHIRPKAVEWIRKHRPPVNWIADRVDVKASVVGQAGPLFAAMRTREVVLVGPEHLKRIPPEVLEPVEHVVIPAHDAWRRVDEIQEQIEDAIGWGDELVLFAAGLASNLLIHRLCETYRLNTTLWDIGSTLDPYAGVFSRSTYQSERWQKNVLPKNLSGDEWAEP